MDNPFVTGVHRITLMRIPLDIIVQDDLPRLVMELAEKPSFSRIIFLDYARFMKARRDSEYQDFVKRAALVVPISKILEKACNFLKLPSIVRYHPFDFIISVLGILEEKRKSLYLLGEKHEGIQKIAGTIRTSFPYINLVGRHAGFYGRDKEVSILQAIQKATPTLLLVGAGVSGREKWFFRQEKLPVKIGIHSEESFSIMTGQTRRPSKKSIKRGSREALKILINPFRLFSYFWFHLLRIFYRLKKVKRNVE